MISSLHALKRPSCSAGGRCLRTSRMGGGAGGGMGLKLQQSTAPKKGSGRPGFGTDEVSCKQTPPCSAARRTGRQACRLAGSKAGRGKFGFTE